MVANALTSSIQSLLKCLVQCSIIFIICKHRKPVFASVLATVETPAHDSVDMISCLMLVRHLHLHKRSPLTVIHMPSLPKYAAQRLSYAVGAPVAFCPVVRKMTFALSYACNRIGAFSLQLCKHIPVNRNSVYPPASVLGRRSLSLIQYQSAFTKTCELPYARKHQVILLLWYFAGSVTHGALTVAGTTNVTWEMDGWGMQRDHWLRYQKPRATDLTALTQLACLGSQQVDVPSKQSGRNMSQRSRVQQGPVSPH